MVPQSEGTGTLWLQTNKQKKARAEGLSIICRKPGLEKKTDQTEAKGLVRMPKVDWRDKGGICLAQAPQGQ